MVTNLVGVDFEMGKVMVMNQDTWEMLKDRLAEDATESPDPLAHLSRYDGIDIIVDEELSFNKVEVYESIEFYHAVLKYGKRSDKNAGDVG
jgi:hypothetical protein